MTLRTLPKLGLAGLLLVVGCTDSVPTFEDPSAIPVDAETVEILLPFSEFVDEFQVFAGFGSRADISPSLLALEYEGELEARTLVRFNSQPASVQAIPTGESDAVADSAYTPIGGRLVVRMDTVRFRPDAAVELDASVIEQEWDFLTASWMAAVDTLGADSPWAEPGAGGGRGLGTATWDPAEGDSVVFQVDSLTATEWSDRSSGAIRSARLGSRTPGVLLGVQSAIFRADHRPSVDPDTVVSANAESIWSTVVYTPEPGVSEQEIRVGGGPARRAFLTLGIPTVLEEGSGACQGVSACPVEVTPERLVYAGLVLRTRPVEPQAFMPLDTLGLDARTVLSPSRIPRSPLGSPVSVEPRPLAPQDFGPDGARRIELPMTGYIAALLQDLLGEEEEGAEPISSTLALMSRQEPSGFSFASLVGPGQEGEPFLRLILTLSDGVQLP